MEEQFITAFSQWGVDVDGAPDEMVAQVQAQPEPVVLQLVAGLDQWARERRRLGRPEADWQRLHDLADRLDNNERRRELRQIRVSRGLQDELALVEVARAYFPYSALISPEAWPRGPNLSRFAHVLLIKWTP